MSTLAERWHAAMRTAGKLDPEHIARAIIAHADTGLRGTRYDRTGRTTSIPCEAPETCDDGPDDHSHHASADPTGNAATGGRIDELGERRRLNAAVRRFVDHARPVLEFVSGREPNTWTDVLKANAALMPGTIQAGLDVDVERILPHHMGHVIDAVADVGRLARDHAPRMPTLDEQHWTAGLADEECCVWHLAIHRRYRRQRLPGKNICQACVQLVLFADGARPPQWLLEAEVDRESKPRAWDQALGRWVDELGSPLGGAGAV